MSNFDVIVTVDEIQFVATNRNPEKGGSDVENLQMIVSFSQPVSGISNGEADLMI